ncbi:Tir chaperone family protein CesT [Prosthecobacter fusiformis]|uniref:Tir chaperone family protein CesT n=1 Tax=Prosthecobacter fusiformis TaxID=48464 RepID=A0A4R7RXU0_9BACT|nr:type III secretion system chaperone [Prosthecobacter fusiformis]TDU70724.1 Tir chaperone family protein CesT [Prosthecobacter fusiformis]
MNLSDALLEVGLLLGQPGLALSEHGTCRLAFDGRLEVDFELLPDGQTLHLSSVVSLLDLEDATSLGALLRANVLGSQTGGAYFSLSPAGEILFERQLHMETIDLTGFTQEIERFVNYLEGWEDQLVSGDLTSSTNQDMLAA